ncbi:unnamed protein product [Didymodactylos carnosus]|uniref:Uncharacterized protein n=1 Tax=Didymodactylos carnosus TaxID=1234261 RepID=A0A814CC35_9BILA|nr:unnamed protein product [Didymodactylos carnosus]CAF0938049.1 unnamed protein product [Didymodactylos carnosus]CAF3689757.1 unnamed protein product [Didymodactylos carnosus]CAF3714934.1 unnamed protein product [Didymodactylos carnosus]
MVYRKRKYLALQQENDDSGDTATDQQINRLSGEIKNHARNNNKEAMRTLAKNIVKMRNQKSRLYGAKAQLESVDNAVKNQLGKQHNPLNKTTLKIGGAMQKSNEIMQSMSKLMHMSEMHAVSQQFAKELMKLGVMEEMIEDATAIMDEDVEEEADEEVTKVLSEILADKVKNMPTVSGLTPVGATAAAAAISDDEDQESFEARLQALRS